MGFPQLGHSRETDIENPSQQNFAASGQQGSRNFDIIVPGSPLNLSFLISYSFLFRAKTRNFCFIRRRVDEAEGYFAYAHDTFFGNQSECVS